MVRRVFVPLLVLALAGGCGSGVTPSNPNVTQDLPTTDIIVRASGTASAEAMSEAAAIIRARFAAAGKAAAAVAVVAPDTIRVRVATDDASLAPLVASRGELGLVPLPKAVFGTFDRPGQQIPTPGIRIDHVFPALVSGDIVVPTSVSQGPDLQSGVVTVSATLRPAAATAFATWTKGHVGEFIAITLDGVVLSTPYIENQITGGPIQVGFRSDALSDATMVGAILSSGPLPFAVEQLSPTPSAVPQYTIPSSPTPTPHTAPSLEALLPNSLGGVALTKQSVSVDYNSGESDNAVLNFLAASPTGTLMVATAATADPNGPYLEIRAIELKGVDPTVLATAMSDLGGTSRVLFGRTVEDMSAVAGGTTDDFAFTKGDTVFVVETDRADLASAASRALP